MLLAGRISSYECTWEVWRALKKLELLLAAPRATLTLLSSSSNFLRASITWYTHAKHEPILNLHRHFFRFLLGHLHPACPRRNYKQGNWGNEVNYGICAIRELHLGCVSITFVRLKKEIKQTIDHLTPKPKFVSTKEIEPLTL